MRRVPCALLVALVLAAARPASAQAPASNEAAAEALFDEGRALIAAGRAEEGCKKLEASQALDAGTGTLLHLADCYEKIGRTASAWARFHEAASRAARDGRADWETIAKTRSAELEPKLARLRIDAPPGVVVRRNGVDIPAAALGSPLPVDPGEHTLTASAPGKKTWTTRIDAAPSRLTAVAVPALEGEGSPPGAAPEGKASGASPLRSVGYAVGAVGIVGLGIGTVSGLVAMSKNGRSKNVCPTSGVCADDSARSDNEAARSAATLSTIGFVAGGALLAGGIALIVLAPSSSSSSGLSARLRGSPQAIWLEGAW